MVYKQYDQESLDAQYNNRLHVPHYAYYLNRWELLSRETEEKLPVIKDLPYGNLQREKLDIYPSARPSSKTLVFIHGGYWQMLDKSMFQFIANGFHSYGVTIVVINYPLAPEVSMDGIALSCKKAICWLYNNVSAFNGDPHQLYVVGHSAGGHLAAMLMTTDWKHYDVSLSRNLLKGVCTISGLFNLVPIYHSYLNKILKMNVSTAERNSPVNLALLNLCPLIIAVGEEETAEFNDQSRELYANWKNKGVDIQFLQLGGENHYSIVETVADSQSVLHHALLDLMKIRLAHLP